MNAVRARLQALWDGAQRWYAGHSQRDQRIILGVLAFAVVCLLYLYGWVPVRDYRARVADEIGEGEEQLRRAVRIVGASDSLRVERESLQKKLKTARERLLPGRGATLGAAALQDRANALAAEKGIAVQSTQVMKDEALPPYRKVAIRLVLSGELQPLAELVSGLEFGQQLAVPFLEVNRRGAAPGAKGPRTLSSTLEVAGFVLAEDAKGDDTGGAEPAAADGSAPGGAPAPPTTVAPVGAPASPPAPPAAVVPPPPGAPAGAPPPVVAPAPPGANPPTPVTTVPRPVVATTSTTRPKRPATTTTTRPVATLPPIVPRPAPVAPPAPAAAKEES